MMGNYEQLKAAVASIVRDNGAEEITGNVLQSVLISIINSVGSGAVFAGIATPSTSPSNPDPNMFYIAVEAGTYPNFNLTVTTGMCIFSNESGTWVGHELNVSSQFESGEYITEVSITDTLEGAETDNLPTVGAINGAVTALNTAITTERHDRQEADGNQTVALNLEKTLRQQGDEANEASVGYYVCDTAAATSAKVVNASGYVLRIGGNIRIEMTNANTAANATLNINGTGAKALFYNGEQASETNSWETGEVLTIYYDGTQYQSAAVSGGLAIKKTVVYEGGIYFTNGGYYDVNGDVDSNRNLSYASIPVSEYVGLVATFNFISGRSSAYSGFKDANGNIISTFQNVTSVIVPNNAVTMFITAIGATAATNTVTFEVDASEDVGDLVNESLMSDILTIQSETASLTGYYNPDGYTLGSGHYHMCIDVTSYRGMKVLFKPVFGAITFTGFKLSDDSYLAIPVSNTDDFVYVVPNNAVELRASYQSSQTDRYVIFYAHKTVNNIYNELLSDEEAADTYINKSVLTVSYDLDNDDISPNKYYKANGGIASADGWYGFKIADFTSWKGQNWVGGTYKIGGSTIYTGGAARCGIINTDDSITLITTNDQYEGEITEFMAGLFVSWRTSVDDAVVELRKFDTNIVNSSDLAAGVQEAKDYTDQRLNEVGLTKLPNVKWYVLGDSISAYGLYVGVGNHYYELIAARNNMTFDPTVQALASDGRTLAVETGDSNSICYDVGSMTSPKIITILAGINDFGHGIPLGTLVGGDGYCVAPPSTVSECTTFAKGLLYVLSSLKSNYPNAVIIYILPMRNNRLQTNTLGLRLEKYWEYIYTACAEYSVPVIELGKGCTLMRGGSYFVDGLHPNVMGQKIMSYYIENYMSLLVPTEWT